jgi:hypothetical protein
MHLPDEESARMRPPQHSIDVIGFEYRHGAGHPSFGFCAPILQRSRRGFHLLFGEMRDAVFEIRDYVDFPASARSNRLGYSLVASAYEIELNRLGFLYVENKELF